jgi:transcriptional regulator with XRE-family HTH domain
MSVRENVKRIREACGVTKTHVAKGLGMSLQGYRYIESGDSKLDVERLKAIGKILNVDSAVFFDDKLTDSVIRERSTNEVTA